MKLDNILQNIDVLSADGDLSREIASLTFDSRTCREGSLFIAVRGTGTDGHAYIPQAVAAGAAAVIYQDGDLRAADFGGATMIRVADSRRALALAAEFAR